MEMRMTTWDAALLLAEKTGISADQVKTILQAQAELAYLHSDAGYPIAGIGILQKVDRPARTMKLRFGPQQGKEVTIPASKKLTFRVAKIAKDAVFNPTSRPADVTAVDVVPDDEGSQDAT
jgi:nucleoid DNA-binding protein